jgi:uncharacterized oxidoreductase
MKISGNTIFIAGGTSGIGLGLALKFRELGNTVIIGGRRTELLQQIAAAHEGIRTVAIDVNDPASIQDAAGTVKRQFPDLNVIVAMAGIMQLEDARTADFLAVAEATVTTNLLGPLRLIAAFTEFLAGKPNATIVTVSSGLAFVPLPFTPTYNATKAAIHSLSGGLRAQLSGTGVQVIELVPPAVQTPLMGQENSETAMPLQDFVNETVTLLENNPDATEILVEQVKFLRNAEAEGRYPEALELLANFPG